MKAKLWIFSAVIALATLTAFESFSTQINLRYRAIESNPATCTIINVGCDLVPVAQCRVQSQTGTRFVWNNTGCTQPTFHSSTDILLPQ